MSQDDAHQQLEDALLGPGDLASALDAIRRGADGRAPFSDGSAPLTWAVSKSLGPAGSVGCVQAMLAAGATVASEPWEQWGTSVHRAAECRGEAADSSGTAKAVAGPCGQSRGPGRCVG